MLEAMTRDHGRHFGMVRGARSLKGGAAFQPGNIVNLVWRARLDEHLGAFQAEALDMRAGRLIDEARSLAGLNVVCALLRLAPERDPHAAWFAAALRALDALETPQAGRALAGFELLTLRECGFPLDLASCAVTGARESLIYVSPRSGRAVGAEAGEAWKERLFKLPRFLIDAEAAAAEADVANAFALTGYFLLRDVFAPLCLAASVHLPRPEVLTDPAKLWRWCLAEGVTVVHLTPPMGQLLLSGNPGGRRSPAGGPPGPPSRGVDPTPAIEILLRGTPELRGDRSSEPELESCSVGVRAQTSLEASTQRKVFVAFFEASSKRRNGASACPCKSKPTLSSSRIHSLSNRTIMVGFVVA